MKEEIGRSYFRLRSGGGGAWCSAFGAGADRSVRGADGAGALSDRGGGE